MDQLAPKLFIWGWNKTNSSFPGGHLELVLGGPLELLSVGIPYAFMGCTYELILDFSFR